MIVGRNPRNGPQHYRVVDVLPRGRRLGSPNHGAKEDTAQPTVLADGIEVFDVRSENFDRLTLRRVEYRARCAGWPANARDRVWEVMW